MNHYDDRIDYSKELNSICWCGSGLLLKNQTLVMLLPCEHMAHIKCLDNKTDRCRLCDTKVLHQTTIFDHSIHPQRFADLLSVSHYDDMCANTTFGFIDSFFDFASAAARMPFIKNTNDGRKFCEGLFSMNNLTLKVYGMERVKMEKNKVYICNHTTPLEIIIMYYLFGTGFLASSIVGSSQLIEKIRDVIKVLTFDRGADKKNGAKNTVEMIKDFVKKEGSICLFPEGMLNHPDTIIRFRSGAFNVGYPVYAVVVKHLDVVADGFINGFLFKLGAKKNINLDVHILGPYYPPFNELQIERVRYDMAKAGDMVLSRVSNRDIKDRKGDHI